MKLTFLKATTLLMAIGFISIGCTQEVDRLQELQGEDASTVLQVLQIEDDWGASEYSGSRTEHDLRVALASKGFAWLSGSPADNEKLSIGKNAQFFGFVALRYESGRSANRGALGRAFFAGMTSEQQKILHEAVLAEANPLKDWWDTRETILTLFEGHLYTGEPIDEERAAVIGTELSAFNATVAIHEARAFAALEDALSDEQRTQLIKWRANPEEAYDFGREIRVTGEGLDRDQLKQLEDLYAKAFSWITGTIEDNEVIPLGQPAQLFGFVSIRHKSGHAASRGEISKSFLGILNSEQLAIIDNAIKEQMSVVGQFLEVRYLFLEQLSLLRTEPDAFDYDRAMELAASMGSFEAEAGWIEAKTYRKIRETMTADQISQMMTLRGDYILDESQVEILSLEERGAQLSILCSGCHGDPGQHTMGMAGPTLDGVFGRSIASAEGFEYSAALQALGGNGPWTEEMLDQFLTAPKTFALGTKMEFQGLLNDEDRNALIVYLEQTR
ncbi:MAG: cytochrome c family protein [Anaerolineae bacterium]